MPLIVVALIIWAVLGSPKKDVANWFYKDKAAPWETVDAFYYPDRSNLNKVEMAYGLKSVEACRDWVYFQASLHRDPGMNRSSYGCGIGRLSEAHYGIPVYRTDTR